MLNLSFLLGLLFAVRNEELIHSQKYDNDSAIKITKMLNHGISKSMAMTPQ